LTRVSRSLIVLRLVGRRWSKYFEADKVGYTFLPARNVSALGTVFDAAGRLYSHGHAIGIGVINSSGVAVEDSLPELLVNLLGYSFNHPNEYCSESGISKGYRF
jgi:hypothetical protein